MKIYEKFICSEDLQAVQDYIKTIKFNTQDDHVPLHDNLFEKIGNKFDIHTRGEMPDHNQEVKKIYISIQTNQKELMGLTWFGKTQSLVERFGFQSKV
jgi:hypothetical protein